MKAIRRVFFKHVPRRWLTLQYLMKNHMNERFQPLDELFFD
jgi:hypothetical protein